MAIVLVTRYWPGGKYRTPPVWLNKVEQFWMEDVSSVVPSPVAPHVETTSYHEDGVGLDRSPFGLMFMEFQFGFSMPSAPTRDENNPKARRGSKNIVSSL